MSIHEAAISRQEKGKVLQRARTELESTVDPLILGPFNITRFDLEERQSDGPSRVQEVLEKRHKNFSICKRLMWPVYCSSPLRRHMKKFLHRAGTKLESTVDS